MAKCRHANIEEVVAGRWCTGCGACVAACPRGAIVMDTTAPAPVPQVGESCAGCGLCVEVCHAVGVDYERCPYDAAVRPDAYLGPYIDTWQCRATDESIRRHASAGGVITALGTWALESGVAEGVLAVREGDAPVTGKVFLATTRGELLSAAGVKYFAVPMNYPLTQERLAGRRIVFVGLPCHLHGLAKLEQKLPWLTDVVVLRIGIFCDGIIRPEGYEFLAAHYGIPQLRLVRHIKARVGQWPGHIVFEMRDTDQADVKVPIDDDYIGMKPFLHKRCLVCADALAEFADVSVGDAWGLETGRADLGRNLVLTRSSRGEDAVQHAIAGGYIEATPIEPATVLHSASELLNYKKVGIRLRYDWFEDPPADNPRLPEARPGLRDRLGNAWFRRDVIRANSGDDWGGLRTVNWRLHLLKRRMQVVLLSGGAWSIWEIARRAWRKLTKPRHTRA